MNESQEMHRLNSARIIHLEIKGYYLSLGRTQEQWEEVSRDPSKFNLVWKRCLGIQGEGLPPSRLRNINPKTKAEIWP